MNTRVYKDKQEVAEQFSQYIEELVNKHNKISIALSGGSTPKVVFDYLAANYQGLDWSKVRLFWGDERCVPPTHNESNYKMTVDHLLSKINIPEENIFRVKGENSPGEEAVAYDQLLQNKLPIVNGIPQFDLVILGMGSDGHTASIFPHEIELWNSENCCEVAKHPDSAQNRITITGKVINHAREVAFLVTGDDKKEKVAAILNNEADSDQYPASLVSPGSGKLHWFLDESAAAGL